MSGTPDGSTIDADDGALVSRLGRLADAPVPASVAEAHLVAIERQSVARRRRRRATLAGVAGAGLLLGSTSLAAAGVLPAPAQAAMHRTLEQIGVDVPRARRADAPRRSETDPGAVTPPTPAPVADEGTRRDGRERTTDGAPGRHAATVGSDAARDRDRTSRSATPGAGRPARSPAPDPAAPGPAAPGPAAPDPRGAPATDGPAASDLTANGATSDGRTGRATGGDGALPPSRPQRAPASADDGTGTGGPGTRSDRVAATAEPERSKPPVSSAPASAHLSPTSFRAADE